MSQYNRASRKTEADYYYRKINEHPEMMDSFIKWAKGSISSYAPKETWYSIPREIKNKIEGSWRMDQAAINMKYSFDHICKVLMALGPTYMDYYHGNQILELGISEGDDSIAFRMVISKNISLRKVQEYLNENLGLRYLRYHKGYLNKHEHKSRIIIMEVGFHENVSEMGWPKMRKVIYDDKAMNYKELLKRGWGEKEEYINLAE